MENIKQENDDMEAAGDVEDVDCKDISPKHCQKLQFSIAQIMGFDTSDTNQSVDSDTITENTRNTEQESSQEFGHPPSKLWRPQPHTPSLPNPTQFPPDPATLALLRHYSIFRSNREPWRSNLLSSYAALMAPSSPKETFPTQPNFRFPTFTFQDPPKFVRGLRNTLGFPSNDRTPHSRDVDGKVEPVMQGKQKTYPCPQCGKIFNAHYNLTRHMPVHTGQQTFNLFGPSGLRGGYLAIVNTEFFLSFFLFPCTAFHPLRVVPGR